MSSLNVCSRVTGGEKVTDLLGKDGAEAYVEASSRLARLAVVDQRDVALQLRRQCDHLAARTHRRDRLLILLTNHCLRCCTQTSQSNDR